MGWGLNQAVSAPTRQQTVVVIAGWWSSILRRKHAPPRHLRQDFSPTASISGFDQVGRPASGRWRSRPLPIAGDTGVCSRVGFQANPFGARHSDPARYVSCDRTYWLGLAGGSRHRTRQSWWLGQPGVCGVGLSSTTSGLLAWHGCGAGLAAGNDARLPRGRHDELAAP
jgi:hypothetical protein